MVFLGGEALDKITKTIYFNRDKEENWDIEKKAKKLGWKNSEDALYVGYEVSMKIEITNEDGFKTKVLKIGNVDVSDKEIYI
jgi:hypothetical protein